MNRGRLGVIAFACSIVASGVAAQTTSMTVIASGLNGPRGLKFGPDGNLYVAEAGTGGTNGTVGTCDQVPSPVGPYTGGKTARISMIRPDGTRSTVVDQLPSSQDFLGDILGVADIAFIDGQLYAALAGGGCSHGNPDIPNAIIKVDRDAGTWQQVANLSQFVMHHPAAHVQPADFEPDETFYGMIATRDTLYVVGPNHGQVLEVKQNGHIRQLIDISATQGHIVPTAIAANGGTFHVGNLNTFPIMPGTSQILDISRKGEILHAMPGFTTVVGLAYRNHRPYAVELSTEPGNPAPGAGKVVRLSDLGAIEDVATGLTLPTALTFGPDGNLYVSNFGAAGPGSGEIVQIALGSSE